ncbi:MAG: hypothetical protein AVDCRST_MAG54-4335, partial [uncultured Actinomycetospora sp.]
LPRRGAGARRAHRRADRAVAPGPGAAPGGAARRRAVAPRRGGLGAAGAAGGVRSAHV